MEIQRYPDQRNNSNRPKKVLIYEEQVKGWDGAFQESTNGYQSPTSSADVHIPINPPQPADTVRN